MPTMVPVPPPQAQTGHGDDNAMAARREASTAGVRSEHRPLRGERPLRVLATNGFRPHTRSR